MDRGSSLRVGAFAGALCALTSVVGCTDDGASLHVICPISPEVEDGKCVFDPASELCEYKGVMNLAAASQYDTSLKVESGLMSRAREVPPRTEPNRLSLTGGEVELRKSDGARLDIPGMDNPYQFDGAGTVSPGGVGAMSVTLIPQKYADRLRENVLSAEPLPQIVAAVKVRGITDGGEDVESGEWLWPIRLIYESPVVGEASCRVMDLCAGLGGLDGFANACLCKPPEDSCGL